jgi:hypothetical protein|tara:strand:+ start:96 stop:350 length:255 start_codon:yes stop_codon:yes gene_type:complete
MIDATAMGTVVYDVQDHIALEPNNNAHYCLIPKQVDQNLILKLQKIMMDIGNHNIRLENCDTYEITMRFIDKHPIVEMFINKED